ncbi:MAG: DUF6650 family protein [Edaphobacter sp.]
MRLQNVFQRITGFSTPFGGVSWNASISEVTKAKDMVNFLEDHRVLFNANALEIPEHCVLSIIEIRHFLTSSLNGLSDSSPLVANIKLMRGACRKFLDYIQLPDREIVRHANTHGHYASWEFYSALGDLRGVFGIALALISETFNIEIDGDLSKILPELRGG